MGLIREKNVDQKSCNANKPALSIEASKEIRLLQYMMFIFGVYMDKDNNTHGIRRRKKTQLSFPPNYVKGTFN